MSVPGGRTAHFLDLVTGWAERRGHAAVDPGPTWIAVKPHGSALVDQGWKLHVSAATRNAEAVLRAALGALEPFACEFKVAASVEALTELNSGAWGPSQIGKFVTVYPSTDSQAVDVARSLVEATCGLAGPRVPSDRRVHPDAPVWYRYGSFVGLRRQTALGTFEDVLRSPTGELEPDRRLRYFAKPDWAQDPFEAAGLTTRNGDATAARDRVSLSLRGRYLVVKALAAEPDVVVQLAVDTVAGRRVVVKRLALETGLDMAPEAVLAEARREADMMARFSGSRIFPEVYDVFVDDGWCHVVMEHLDGVSLTTWIRDRFDERGRCDDDELRAVLAGVARVLQRLHDAGYVYADLKADHVFVGGDEVRLLDAESVLGHDEEFYRSHRTPGYASPQQLRHVRPTVSDDVHCFGALLHEALTGCEPWMAPDRTRLLDRPVRRMQPAAPPDLEALACACLAPDPAQRPADFVEVERALTGTAAVAAPSPVAAPRAEAVDLVAECEDLVAAARPGPAGGLVWPDPVDGSAPVGLGAGTAGVVLALTEIRAALDTDRFDEAILGGCASLVDLPARRPEALPGLYVGECGIGLALLGAGEALGRADLVEAGVERVRATTSLDALSPDLFSGTAGRLRAHLAVWRSTGSRHDLAAARRHAERLAEECHRDGDAVAWTFPQGYETLSGKTVLGYAHGLAGIADALLDLECVDPDPAVGALVDGAVQALVDTALAGGPPGARHWPTHLGSVERCEPFWCHGATGVARFLLRAHVLRSADAASLVDGACIAIASQTHLGPSQCHGLAGNLEVLLDAGRTLGREHWVHEAQRLADVAAAFLVPDDGITRTTERDLSGPSLLTGRGGVLRALARLRRPDALGALVAPLDAHTAGWTTPK